MQTPNDIYNKLLFKVNKNSTNTDISIPKGVFVILFNEQKRKYLYQELYAKESTDLIDSFEEILSVPTKLKIVNSLKTITNYKLPNDFFKRVSAYVLADKGDCKNNPMIVWPVKPKDVNVLLQNENHKPSFEYQETIGIINSDQLTVYKDDTFILKEAYLTYYKNPPDIDISGYTRLDGKASKDTATTLSDLNIDKILDRTVVEISTNYQDVERLQLAFQRQQINEK
jgi:hypothetical protein